MILTLQLTKNRKGQITSPISSYKPDEKSKKRLKQILEDFTTGKQTMDKPYREFNDMSVLQRQSADQASFNIYVEPKSNDPDEAWHSQAIRPIVRNRIISIAAHVTGALIYPLVEAQNEQDEEDLDSAVVMRDLFEWTTDQSNYSQSFLYSVIAALVNPAVIIHTEFANRMRTVKEVQADGGWTTKDIIDEIYSGFQDNIVPVDELFIGDIYEHNIQKQPFLIWRRCISYEAAAAKYGYSNNFKKYVKPGIQIFYDQTSDTFYEQYDEDLKGRLVEEVIYYNRTEDLQIPVCNGVLLTDPEQPNPRKDKNYPFVKGGYELIDEGKFFYYSSLAKKLSKDEEVVNTLYRLIIDGSFLQLMPPVAVFGNEEVNSSVVTPGTVTTFGENTKLQRIDVGGNLNAGYSALEKVESSISESSNDVLQSGQSTTGSQTAFEISRLEQNARIMLGMFAKMISFMVRDYGYLRGSDILQYLTVGDAAKITDGLKFSSFIIPDRNESGKKKTRRLQFDLETGKGDAMQESFNTLNEEGGLNSDVQIYKINPKLFRERKFKFKVSPDLVTPPSDNVKKALNLEEFDRAIQLPFIDQRAITRDLLLGSYDATKANTDKYIIEEQLSTHGSLPIQSQGSPLGKLLDAPIGTPQDLIKTVA